MEIIYIHPELKEQRLAHQPYPRVKDKCVRAHDSGPISSAVQSIWAQAL